MAPSSLRNQREMWLGRPDGPDRRPKLGAPHNIILAGLPVKRSRAAAINLEDLSRVLVFIDGYKVTVNRMF